jgi:hypothetical protein
MRIPGLTRKPGLAKLRSFGLFGISVLLNGTISLITIPIIVAIAGAEPWASMATGQSIGASFGVLVIFGWGLTGPVSIAMASAGARPGMFLDSLFARATLLVPLLIVQAAVTFAIVPHEKGVAFLAGTAMTLAGASANWYFTGESRPGRFLLLDTVPRATGTVVGVLLLVSSGQLWLFALSQLAGALVALVVSSVTILRGQQLDYRAAARWQRILTTLRDQRHGVVATGAYAAYTPAVLAIVALLAPTMLPVFVLADRLAKFVAMAVSPLTQVLQGWVPAASGTELVRRIKIAGWALLATALITGTLYAALLPFFSQLLTHGQVDYEVPVAIGFGLVSACSILSPYLTNIALMAVGRLRAIALSAVIGMPASLVALLVVELVGASEFAVWTLVAGNIAIMLWQFWTLRRTLAHMPEDPPETPLTPPLTLTNAEGLLSRS